MAGLISIPDFAVGKIFWYKYRPLLYTLYR